jgi:hypothetical protein
MALTAPPRPPAPAPPAPHQASAAAVGGKGAAAAPPAPDLRRPLCAHLRVLPWLLPGLAALLIGHLTASHAAAGPGASPWLQRAGAFGTLQGAGPVIVGACGGGAAAAGGAPEAMQLVFANYAGCAAGRGGCPAAAAGGGDWGWGSASWST